MEQIYTIPVNEAFEAGMKDEGYGCPFCRLHRKLEKDEVELILGASMMEPDVRQKTNEQGFCPSHYALMLKAGKKLPFALVLQSHLGEIGDMLKKPGLVPVLSGAESAKKLNAMSADCYICRRIEYNFNNMIDTAALLWEADDEFRGKCAAQSMFCLPHFARFVASAKDRMKGKAFGEFYKAMYAKEDAVLLKTTEDIDRFVKKFDYRYADEPWNGAENAVERTLTLLDGTDCSAD